jgi:CRP-like cAMP-binding protein
MTDMIKKEKDYLEDLKERIRSLVPISESDLNMIVNEFEYRKVNKDDFLLEEGQRCYFWGFVNEGLIRVYSHTDTGEEYTNGFVREGGFITDFMSFYTQSPSLENMIALEDTKLICINFETLQKLYENFPAFDKFARISYEKRITELKARIIYRIRLDAYSRYQHFITTQPELIKRVPLKHIASYLNITDSTLSRIRRKMLHHPG